MIDAMRRRADTHSSSSRLNETPNRAPFLRFLSPIPPSEGVFPPPNPPSQSKNVHAQRGFLNCFFWCGQPSARTFHEEEEDDEDEDVAVGLPDYLFGRLLGEGRMGEVRHAIRRSDGESVAVKCVKRHRHSQKEEESVMEEAAVLSLLSHSSIVCFLGFEPLPSYHYLVLELLDGGRILDAVGGLGSYTEHDARQIAIAILGALQHAHVKARCVHRDLTPENLLISRDTLAMGKRASLGQRVKISGWGRSKRLPESELVPGENCFGNRAFSAPEMILEEDHGAPADMFAVGAILYTLLSGLQPRITTLAAAASPKAPDTSDPAWGSVSKEGKDLVLSLMSPGGAEARTTADEALEHTWIKAGKDELKSRSLDSVLKGARVLSWRMAMLQNNQAAGGGSGRLNRRSSGSNIPRVFSLF